MNRFHTALATALAFAIPAAFAQMGPAPSPRQERVLLAQAAAPEAPKVAVEAPQPKCEDPGAFPGRVGMQTEDRRNKFIKGVETYKTCMMAFVEERKAVIKANETAARAAIDEFNARMKRYAEEQEKAKE
jgi:hypothetical protein